MGGPSHQRSHNPQPIAPPARRRQGKRYFEYNCCEGYADHDTEECGDYIPHYTDYTEECGEECDEAGPEGVIIFGLFVIIGLAFGITVCCYHSPRCPWHPPYVENNHLLKLRSAGSPKASFSAARSRLRLT